MKQTEHMSKRKEMMRKVRQIKTINLWNTAILSEQETSKLDASVKVIWIPIKKKNNQNRTEKMRDDFIYYK